MKRKKQQGAVTVRRGVITSVICSLVGINTILAVDNVRPRLVVGIMVDQLRTDHIEYLQNLFGDKGFRRLMKDGVYIKDVDFKVPGLDAVSGSAMIYTGSYPRYTGVNAEMVYSPETKGMVNVLNDPASIGNFTTETLSPSNIRISTISDEIAVAGQGKASIFSIAPDAQQSIVMAGHAANSAFWINENTGNWATTTYYQDSPSILTQKNYTNPIAARLDTMAWTPLRGNSMPNTKSADKKGGEAGFRHTFPIADRDVYKIYASSPLVNTEITDAAISYLQSLPLGRSVDTTDMLNLAYTAAPFLYDNEGNLTAETEDTYIRLDGQLERLFDAIDRYVGLDNTFVYVVSTGYYDEATPEDGKYKIPTGTFSVKRALSLLNSYLSAHYGNGAYVDTFSKDHVYLNHKEIEEKGLDLKATAELARDFLVKMSGVNDAYTMSDIMASALPSMEALRLATDPKTGGDIILEFNAGWSIVDDTRFPNEIKTVRADVALTPAFLMWPPLVPEVIDRTVEAVSIAPTVSQALRIRAPNGAVGKPITLNTR